LVSCSHACFDADEMLDIDMEGVDPFNDEEIDRDVMKRAKSENKEDDADLNEKDKAKGDPVWEAWSFDCLCGQKVDSSAPKSKHPEGEQVCCGACNVWMHLNCLPEYKVKRRVRRERIFFFFFLIFRVSQVQLRCVVHEISLCCSGTQRKKKEEKNKEK
jgi:hypothetical protein